MRSYLWYFITHINDLPPEYHHGQMLIFSQIYSYRNISAYARKTKYGHGLSSDIVLSKKNFYCRILDKVGKRIMNPLPRCYPRRTERNSIYEGRSKYSNQSTEENILWLETRYHKVTSVSKDEWGATPENNVPLRTS